MNDERWVVLGVGHPRARWFAETSRWATNAAIPVDFVKCVSADEARVRLASGRAHSALLIGADLAGLDRDLIDAAGSVAAAVIVVGPLGRRDWSELGVAAVLPVDFERGALVAALQTHAAPLVRVPSAPAPPPLATTTCSRGRLIAVTGPGGTGSSIAAMALAQAFAAAQDEPSSVLLADLRLDAELGMLHDAREVMPGLPELVEAHRGGRLAVDQIRALTFDAVGRGYQLLLGLRNHRDWTSLRPKAFAAALDGLLASYRLVVADIDPDLEGQDSTGSADVEDRNLLARRTTASADVVVVVGNPTTKGIHSLVRVARHLDRFGLDGPRIVPVFTRAGRSPRQRAEAVRAFAALVGADAALRGIGNPVFVSERNDIEDAVRDGFRLPAALGRPLHSELLRRLEVLERPRAAGVGRLVETAPEPVAPGSIGSWTEEVG